MPVSLLSWANSSWGYALGALLVVVFSILTLVPWPLTRSRKHGDTVLLLGPSDAGKTAILTYLTYEQFLPTHTSLQSNETRYKRDGSSSSIRLLDIPGHPRIRAQFAEHLESSKGIIFVIDTSTIARNGASVAEHLHLILHAISRLPPSAHIPPILIYANKCDLISVPASSVRQTVAADRVRTILERELEKRRQSSLKGVSVAGLGGTSEEQEEDGAIHGGLECIGDGSFNFAKWEGGDISVVGGFVSSSGNSEKQTGTGSGLDEVLSWLDGL